MIKRKLKICKSCEKEKIIFAKKMCSYCYSATKSKDKRAVNEQAGKRISVKTTKGIRKPIQKKNTNIRKYSKTGELELFKEIWEEREHYCFICSKPILEAVVSNFMHVVAKGKSGALRLVKENIVIGCHDFQSSCHEIWDKKPRSTIKDNPMWSKMFELEEEMKQL